jgi:hypothetical protein
MYGGQFRSTTGSLKIDGIGNFARLRVTVTFTEESIKNQKRETMNMRYEE